MILSIFKFSVMSENILATVIYLIISFLVTAYGLFQRRVVNSEKEPHLNISGLNVSNLGNSIPGGGGATHMKQTGMHVGNFEFNP